MNSKENNKSLKIMHTAMVIGVALIYILFHYSQGNEEMFSFKNDIDSLSIVFSVIVFGLTAASSYVPQAFSSEGTNGTRARYIVKWGFLEGAALIAVMGFYFLDTHIVVLFLGMIALVLLLLAKPKF